MWQLWEQKKNIQASTIILNVYIYIYIYIYIYTYTYIYMSLMHIEYHKIDNKN